MIKYIFFLLIWLFLLIAHLNAIFIYSESLVLGTIVFIVLMFFTFLALNKLGASQKEKKNEK